MNRNCPGEIARKENGHPTLRTEMHEGARQDRKWPAEERVSPWQESTREKQSVRRWAREGGGVGGGRRTTCSQR